jgi:hypothetical protein
MHPKTNFPTQKGIYWKPIDALELAYGGHSEYEEPSTKAQDTGINVSINN